MEQSSISYSDFKSDFDVSRETFEKLTLYHQLLLKWQRSINLVSPKTIENSWERHFIDSAQSFLLISDKENPIFDLGSGGGFPGLVISIMGIQNIHLIESDQRKGIFLSEVIRQTECDAKVHMQRIESFKPEQLAGTITSRACAPLHQLLRYAAPLLKENGRCLFLKGRDAKEEVREAQHIASFHVEHHLSRTDPDGCILEISNLAMR